MVTYTLTGQPETLDMKLICRSQTIVMQLRKDKNDRAQAQYDNSDCMADY